MTNEERKAHKREQYSQQKARERKQPQKLVRVYLSAPMTGRTPDEIRRDFDLCRRRAVALFGRKGARVVTVDPSCFRDRGTWADNRLYDITVLRMCHAVVVAPGWQFSRGCRVEAEMAEGMGKPVVEAEGIKK